MKFTTLKETFEDRLALSSRFTSSRVSSVQSIQGAFIEVKGKDITIMTTNLGDFFYTHISGDIEEEGAVVFDLKKALEFLNFLKPGEISVSLEGSNVVIQQGKTKGYFNTYYKDDFPELPVLDGKTYDLDSGLLNDLPSVLFSASRDETRPVMTGVYITNSGGKNFFVTTDGFRLSLLEKESSDLLPDVILPASMFSEVVKLAKGEKVVMTLSPEDKLVKFTIGDIDLYSRVIEGEFPPYEKVMPKTSTTSVTVNSEEFTKNIRLVSVFAREEADVVILDISEKGMFIRPKSSQSENSEVFQELEEQKGEAQKIAFNYKYILDLLNAVQSDKMTFECTLPTAPGLFRADNKDGYMHVIMPLRTDETTGT